MPTDIEWTHMPGYIGESWNLIAGCTKISPGCANCYAETMGLRFHRSGPFLPGNPIRLLPERLGIPFRWKNPRMVFVNSTSDTFHEDVPDSFLVKIYAVMALTPRHIYLMLTKCPDYVPGLRNPGWLWGAYRPMEIKSEPYRARIVNLDPHERQFTRAIKDNDAWMIKGSKGGNGNELDGRTWEEFPTTGNKRIAS